MNRDTIDSRVFLNLLYDAGESPRRYSGRGMNGQECIGVVTDDIFALGVSVGGAVVANDLGFIPASEMDSLGSSMIVYWPAIAWPAKED